MQSVKPKKGALPLGRTSIPKVKLSEKKEQKKNAGEGQQLERLSNAHTGLTQFSAQTSPDCWLAGFYPSGRGLPKPTSPREDPSRPSTPKGPARSPLLYLQLSLPHSRQLGEIHSPCGSVKIQALSHLVFLGSSGATNPQVPAVLTLWQIP